MDSETDDLVQVGEERITRRELADLMENWGDRLTGNVFEDMLVFDEKYGFNQVEMTPKFFAFRMRFLFEELFEIVLAAEAHDPEGVVDGLIDLIVVAAGTLSIGRVNSQTAWNEVRRANMSKERRANPTRSGSGGADLVKPAGWRPPDHTENVGTIPLAIGPEFNEHFSHSVTILFEAAKMQFRKNSDYDSEESGLKRADYFIHGLDSLEYEINKKHLRFRSVLAKLRAGIEPEYESLHDSLVDKINYESFAAAWIRGKLEGQDPNSDFFNKPKVKRIA